MDPFPKYLSQPREIRPEVRYLATARVILCIGTIFSQKEAHKTHVCSAPALQGKMHTITYDYSCRSQISYFWSHFTRLGDIIWKGARGGPAARIWCMGLLQNWNYRRFPRHTALPFSLILSRYLRNTCKEQSVLYISLRTLYVLNTMFFTFATGYRCTPSHCVDTWRTQEVKVAERNVLSIQYALSDIRVYLRPSSHIAGHIKNTRKEQHVLQIWEPGTHGLPHQCQDTCRTHTPHFKNKNVLSLCNIGEYRIHAHATQCVNTLQEHRRSLGVHNAS